MGRATVQLKRQLQLWHRWFGIVLALPIALWFVSGAVLVFVPFPRLLESERLAGLPPLALERVRVGPQQAARVAGIQDVPADARLGMLGPDPVWRLGDERGRTFVVDAVAGARIGVVEGDAAVKIARDFQARSTATPASPPRYSGPIDHDQWTVSYSRTLQPPLHRLRFDDGMVLYVSELSGEVVRDASRAERGWGWPGAVVHWIYVTPLRSNGPLWTQVVLWLSGVSLVVAVSGLGLGLWRSVDAWRRSRRLVPFRRGWYAWHHWLGLAGGALVLTWIFSGFMSMSPFDLPRNAAADAWRQAWSRQAGAWPDGWRLPTAAGPGRAGPVEVQLRWLDGQPWYRHLYRDGSSGWEGALEGSAAAPNIEALIAHATVAGGHTLRQREWLTAEDAHYVSHPHRDPRPLPVWRLRLDDPARSSIYVSPERAEIVAIDDRAERLNRWLYSGLHSWDLPWLLQRPWLRYALLLLGLAIGLTLTMTGFVIGWRRLTAGR